MTKRISQSIILDNPRTLAVLDAIDMDTATRITRINVPAAHRGKGYGRTMLKAACDMADLMEEKLYIEVAAYADSPMNNDALREWYERYGFVDFGGHMRRLPR